MDAGTVAGLLNEWWPLRPRRNLYSQPEWPPFTGSVLDMPRDVRPRGPLSQMDRHAIPVLWTATGYDGPDQPLPGHRRLADHPHTTNRFDITLIDPTPTWNNGVNPTPDSASNAATLVLTLRHVAANLQDRAALPKAPKRSLNGEASVYLEAADRVEELLPALAAPWQDQARAEIAAAKKTPLPPARPPVPLVPGSFR